jgi:Metallo-peptidase family M12B Reprolysin-like
MKASRIIIATAAALCALLAVPMRSTADDGSLVDLLVVYTPEVRSDAGGTAAIQGKITTWLGEVNTALSSSGVAFQYRLVGTAEVPYTGEPFHANIMQHLKNVDGQLDQVLTLRETYRADLVHLILTSSQLTDSCGSGFVLREGDPSPGDWGFSITSYSCDGYAGSRYQLAHALGHNFGLQHSPTEIHDDGRVPGPPPGITPYAYGYVDPQNRFRDVMADDCPADGPNAVIGLYHCPRALFYSTTTRTFGGETIGNAANADGARVMNEKRTMIANYRDSTVTSSLYSLDPCRALDTRAAVGTYGGPALVAGADRTFLMAGRCGVPSTAKAVSINVTVTQPSAAGDLRLFPAGLPAPVASVINFTPGQTRANNAIVMVNAAGEIAVRDDQAPGAGVHLIIDVNGYFQ